jgi:hypothetical protein
MAPGPAAAAPIAAPAYAYAAPAPAPGYAAYPQYRYPYAYPRPASAAPRLGPILVGSALTGIVGISIIALVVVGLLAVQGTFEPCTQRCGPRQVSPLPELNSFTSSTYHYQVGYPPNWAIQQQDGGSVAFSTRIRGAFVVRGQKAGKSDAQLIQEAIAGLPSSQWQNVQVVATLHGSHIGFQDGAGTVYSADLAPAGGQAQRVRIAALAASRGGLSVTVLGIDPADPKNSPNGIPEADDFDFVLSQFTWPSG